jgi:hypothetical protein
MISIKWLNSRSHARVTGFIEHPDRDPRHADAGLATADIAVTDS